MYRLLVTCFTIILLFNAVVLAAPVSSKEISYDINSFDGKVGVYAVNLKTGKSISYNGDVVFPTASTSKLVVVLAVYKYLYPTADQEKKNQYDNDIAAMIKVSDNDGFYELLDELGTYNPLALKKVTTDLGLKQTFIHDDDAYRRYNYHSVTTPLEMSKVMQAIYDERYLGKNRSLDLKNKLANTIFNDEIPRYTKYKVMHKVGQLDSILCDVGIIDDGKEPILISFYTSTDNSDSYASDFIASTAGKIYNVLRKSDSKPAVSKPSVPKPPRPNMRDYQ